jgi:arabinogalactan endo-1,4-beta-galactosidase
MLLGGLAALLLGLEGARGAEKLFGFDANYALEMKETGKRWEGADLPYAQLKAAGGNAFRVRLWTGDEGPNGLKYATETARAAQEAGLRPYLVLFLSENWADMVKQPVPAIWKDLPFEQKLEAIEAYTEKVAKHFKDEGIQIGLYEIGNEVDFGLCGEFEPEWPKRVSLQYMRAGIWPKIAAIAKAAQAGVRKAAPEAEFTMHLALWHQAEYCTAYWQYMLEQGVRLDCLGISYFPSSADKEADRALPALGVLADAYRAKLNRPVVICEMAFPAASGFGGQFADWQKPVAGYEFTEAGQAQWLADVRALVRDTGGLGGAFYWSPEWYGTEIWHAFALYTPEGKPRAALGTAAAARSAAVEAPRPPARPYTRNLLGVNVYFGNLHAHTAVSDGTGTPEEAYAYARDVAGLDFLALTEHNHLMGGDKATWETRRTMYAGPAASALVPAAEAANRDGKFVALYGQEYSSMSKGNHINVFDVKEVIDVPNGDFAGLMAWMQKNPDSSGRVPVVQFNHPALGKWGGHQSPGPKEYGRDDFGGEKEWVAAMGGVTSLIELLNGEPAAESIFKRAPQIMDQDYLRYLQLGFRLAPTGNQDNHKKMWGDATDARTGLLAPELTRPALLQAMRDRHAYASEDKNLAVVIRVNGALCGDVLKTPGPLAIQYELADADETDASYTLDALKGQVGGALPAVVKSLPLTALGGTLDGVTLDAPGEFVLFRVTQSSSHGQDRVWTAPVWLE